MSAVDDSWIELASVHNLDTIYKSFCIKSRLSRSRSKVFLPPSRVIMHDQSPLSLGIFCRLHRIRIKDSVIVFCKESIEMSHFTSVAGDFHTRNDNQTMLASTLLGHFVREIEIHHDARFLDRLRVKLVVYSLCVFAAVILLGIFDKPVLLRPVFKMLSYGHDVKTVLPSLISAEFRTHMTIRKNGMSVQIGLQDLISIYIWKDYLLSA